MQPGGGDSGAAAALAVHQAGHGHDGPLQPLQPAAHDPGRVRTPTYRKRSRSPCGDDRLRHVQQVPADALPLALGAPPGAQATGLLDAPRPAPRALGDGVTITAQCHGTAGTLCRGIATLKLQTPSRGAPRQLASRPYLQLAGVTRDLTLYLNARAIHYPHRKRRVPTILSLATLGPDAVAQHSSQTVVLNGSR